MKAMLGVLLLWSVGAQAGGYGAYVFGDSLTSPQNSWANQLNRMGLANLQINAVPGRRLIDLQVPTDLRRTMQIKTVIFHLGTNDAGQGIPIDQFTDHYRAQIDRLDPNLNVVCILPPHNDIGTDVEPYRMAVMEVCPQVIDAPTGAYIDGLHMSPAGHFWHGAIIYNQLENM